MGKRIRRRDVILTAGGLAAALALASCASPPAPTPAPAKPTEAPKPADAPTKPASAAPATTSVPAPTPAATKPAAPAPTGKNTAQLAWGWPDHLNTFLATSARQFDPMRRIHSRLIQWGKDVQKLQPEVATEWSFADGDKTMTFKLDKDARWHDGQPLTARDVAYTLSMAMHPATGSRYRSLMTAVVGYEEYGKGAASVPGLEVRDPQTLVIKTTRPSPELLTAVLPMVAIMPEHVLKDVAPEKLREHPQLNFGKVVGSGAYKLASVGDRQFLELERWNEYWGKKPQIERIVGRNLDGPAQVALLEKGELHLAGSFHGSPVDVERLRKAADLREIKQAGNIPNNLSFNVKKPYLSDKRVRQAVSYAIDRELIASKVMKGLFVPYQTRFGYPWLQPIQGFQEYKFDQARARQLLKDASYDTNRELDFVLSTKDPSDDLVVIQQMLADVGIKLKFRSAPEPANTEERRKGNFDMWGGGGVGWETDPSALLPSYGCGLEDPKGLNYQGYCNPKFDEAMARGAASLNEEARKPAYWEAANVLNDDLPMVFVMLRVNTFFVHKTLQDATPQGTALPNDDGFADWKLT